MINQIKKFAGKNRFCERMIYVAYRICMALYSLVFLVCRIFPVQENKIVCCNMKGKRYGDNPKYILDEIIRQGLDYELVWLMKSKDDEDMPRQVKRAAYNPFSIAYHLSTAKVWIDSNMKSCGVLKRKNQYYIQTWHGSYGLKKIACDINGGKSLIDTYSAVYNAKLEDVMVSNSRKTTEIYRDAFRYPGYVLECGSPRNDIFFEEQKKYRDRIDRAFGTADKRIVLYAPTFRADFNTDCMHMDFDGLLCALEQRFGGEWVALVRLHPNNMQNAKSFIPYSERILNATNYNVMQELLVASELLITDYSSCMFDFVTTRKPCFLYATDIDRYKGERDFYFDIFELPFPVAQNNEEMVRNIRDFDQQLYQEKLERLFEQVGLCDKGTACRQVVEYIEKQRGKAK